MTKQQTIKLAKDWIKYTNTRFAQKKGWGDHPTDHEKEAYRIILLLLGEVEKE